MSAKKARTVKVAERRPTLTLKGPRLTVLLAYDPDDRMVCAFCPELDLVVEEPTEQEALDALLEAMRLYAEEYANELEIYQKSPNRAHHWPYVQAVLAAEDDWDLKALLDVRYGTLQL